MPLEWITDPRAFSLLAETWESLRTADPESTFFHTPRYLKLYWEELGQGPPLIALVGDRERPLAICALEVRDGVLSFLGGYEVTDYMGPVARPEDRSAVAKELMTALAARDDWQRGDLEGLPEDGGWLPALEEAAGAAGLDAAVAEDDVAPVLDLPDTWDAYLQGLKGKFRHEIRRKERRLRERFPDARLVASTAESADADIDWFVAMHRASEGAKGRFMHPGMELFFRRLARALVPDGVLRLLFLEAGGRKMAGALAFRFEGSMLLYNSAYDPAAGDVAPGMVLISEIVRLAIAEGCGRLDLLKGDLGYKYRFGARPRPVRRLLLARR